jgi:hypothetical protein
MHTQFTHHVDEGNFATFDGGTHIWIRSGLEQVAARIARQQNAGLFEDLTDCSYAKGTLNNVKLIPSSAMLHPGRVRIASM